MGELASIALAADPELREQAARAVRLMLADVERTFRIGDPKDKAIYARQLWPILLRSMGEVESSADNELRETFDRVMSAVRGDGGPSPPAAG